MNNVHDVVEKNEMSTSLPQPAGGCGGKEEEEEKEHSNSNKTGLLVWSVPRGRSTALERAFSQHPEIMVKHELLTEPYLKEKNAINYEKIKNGQQKLSVTESSQEDLVGLLLADDDDDDCKVKSQEVVVQSYSYADILQQMKKTAKYREHQEKPYFFSKELSCYFDEGKCSDDWLHSFHHVILVRDPSDALKSFYRVGLSGAKETVDSLYFDASESGFKECKKIIEKIESIQAKYMVIDADLDLMKNPEQTLKQICAFASIPFHKNMLSWNPQELESWKKFRGWHDDAVNSSSFKAPDRTESNAEEYPKEIYEAIADSMEYYRFCIYKRKDDARSLID